jgi:biopolymer transport protein ExbD
VKIPPRKHKAEVPSVAMGDIAFNLLIFFVILAKAQDDSHLNWTPAATAKVESAGATRVSVLINSENKLHLNGQPIGLSQLAPRVKELLGDAPAGDRTVVLKVHRESQALQFEPVIEAISEAGGDLVHILEEKRP